MKSLVPWMCLIAASASQTAFSDDAFNAYRLGNYNQAAEPLLGKLGQDAVANYYLGRLYLYGYGQLKNDQLALRYFTKSAEKGYLPAVQFMAKYTLLKQKNPQEAIRWFKQAAAAGDVSAQMYMAAAYLYGLGVNKNEDVASHFYIDAAKNGNAVAQFALAENFIGSRHSSNNKLGLIWLSKSAAGGNPRALTKLGNLYIDGKLMPKDIAKGEALLNQAAAENYTPALIALGDAALQQNEYDKAIQFYNKAANAHDPAANLQLAHVYLQDKNPIYDAKTGFLSTLKAAEEGSTQAKTELAALYQKGIGVEPNAELAQQWLDKASQDAKKQTAISPIEQVALWLSNGQTNKLEGTAYQLTGIFSPWNNQSVLRTSSYNQAPQLTVVSRQDLFKPLFAMTQPNEIPINSYYDALISRNDEFQANQWAYPKYPLNPMVEALDRANSFVVAKFSLPAPYIDANYYTDDGYINADLLDTWTRGWQKQVNYMAVFNQLYSRAILGDGDSQFAIGQMFQYGIGVPQSDASAIIFYENATEQKHLGAEYNLGLISLQNAQNEQDYQAALNWLTDGAFKGNKKSQYVLARVLAQGKAGPDGKLYINTNPEQALSMLYLSAANNFGPAQYDLAEHLAREYNNGLSVEVKKHKIALIRSLYEGAAANGVAQALLPLAYYNAMDSDPQKQASAFQVAENQANVGDENAYLLLGLLYDRGIGVAADPAKAIEWYQKTQTNPVSQFILGTYTTEGKGIAEDKEEGLQLLKQSAESKFSYADYNLAVLQEQSKEDFLPALTTAYKLGDSHAGIVLADYYLAKSTDADAMNQAKEIYAGLAEKGDQYAQMKLAFMLDKGLGAPADPLAAQRWYTAAAEQGNVEAQYLLGQFYQLGEVGEPDYAAAKLWYGKAAQKLPVALVALGFIYDTVDDNYAQALKSYEEAAAQGNVLGQYNLALMYEYGKGTPVDYPKAKALFVQAAAKGINEAMNQLGGMYFYGLGEARNVQEALTWYKKAADLGNANALYQLGLLSETGVASTVDLASALNYYQKASELGNDKAMLALARMYHYGLGVEKDLKMSASLYQKLADRQNAYAQFQLGSFYLDGTAGEHSPEKGLQLLKQSSENGNAQANKMLQRLGAKTQARVSYLEPVQINNVPVLEGQTADLMYVDALNQWDQGDEVLSRMILQRLVTQYPDYIPAKNIYEQLNQAKLSKSYS